MNDSTDTKDVLDSKVWAPVMAISVLLLAASAWMLLRPRDTDPPFSIAVLVVAVVTVLCVYLAGRTSLKPNVRSVCWGIALTGVPATFVANLTVLYFGWVLTTGAAVVIAAIGVGALALNVVRYLSDSGDENRFMAAGRAGFGLGSGVMTGVVVCLFGLRLVGSPVASPDCEIVDEMRTELEAGRVPVLDASDLDCLRQEFLADAMPRVIADTTDGQHGLNHSQAHHLSNVMVYHHEDSTQLIPGPTAELRPIRGTYLNSTRTLRQGARWVHWTEVDSLGLGLPGANIPNGVSYALLIQIDSTENTQSLIENLRLRKVEEIEQVWTAWHAAVEHDHLSPEQIEPAVEEELHEEEEAVNFKFQRGRLIKLYVPAEGDDYRFNLVRYYKVGTNIRDQALWLEHSHYTPCEPCEIHGWCSDE